MYRPHKYYRRGSRNYYNSVVREWPRYRCEDCRIGCTSFKQLEQHLSGIKHRARLNESSKEAEDNTFSLEHMVVLDQTEDDLPNDYAASPATCDSSDSETAECSSGGIPRSHMVVLDETNDDCDDPASPQSCDSSVSESAPSSPEAEATHGTSKKSTGKKHPAKSDKPRRKSQKTFHIDPVKSNKDVFQFLKTFAIANDSDLAFSAKVKEMFCHALRKYEEKKLEEIFCTEAEHSSPEEPMESTDSPSNHEDTNSIPQEPSENECESITSTPGSPTNSSTQCILDATSSAECQQDSSTINQSFNPNTSSIASRSPTKICEDIDTSNKLSETNDDSCSATEADLLMESESCVTAEASCSEEDDV